MGLKSTYHTIKTQPGSILLIYICHALRIFGLAQWYGVSEMIINRLNHLQYWSFASAVFILMMIIPLAIYLFFTYIIMHIISGFYQTSEFTFKKFKSFAAYATAVVIVIWGSAVTWEYLASGVVEEWALWYYFITGLPLAAVLMIIGSEAYARFFMINERQPANAVICLVEKETYKRMIIPTGIFVLTVVLFTILSVNGMDRSSFWVVILGMVSTMIWMDIEFFGRYKKKK